MKPFRPFKVTRQVGRPIPHPFQQLTSTPWCQGCENSLEESEGKYDPREATPAARAQSLEPRAQKEGRWVLARGSRSEVYKPHSHVRETVAEAWRLGPFHPKYLHKCGRERQPRDKLE